MRSRNTRRSSATRSDSLRGPLPGRCHGGQATIQTNELVNEHEIMQKAYAQANEVVEQASQQAQTIIDNAIVEANGIRQSAVQYTDDMLKSLQNILNHTLETAQAPFNSFLSAVRSSYDIVTSNRGELASGIIGRQRADDRRIKIRLERARCTHFHAT